MLQATYLNTLQIISLQKNTLTECPRLSYRAHPQMASINRRELSAKREVQSLYFCDFQSDPWKRVGGQLIILLKQRDFEAMRRLTTLPCEFKLPEADKPKTAMGRQHNPLRDLQDNCHSPIEAKSVKPFELASLDENMEFRGSSLRQAVREEIELLRRQQHRFLQEGFKELRAEIAQIRDAIEEKPDRKGLDNYLNARLQQLSLETQSKNQQLKTMFGQLDRTFNEKLQQNQVNFEALSKQIQGERKAGQKNTTDHSKIQMLEANVQFLLKKIDGKTEGRSSFNRKKEQNQRDRESTMQRHDELIMDFQRDIRTVRAELKLQMAELTQELTSLGDQIKQQAKELQQKISMSDISEMLEELGQKNAKSALNIEKLNTALDEMHQQQNVTERNVSRLQQKISKYQNSLDSTISDVRCTLEQQLAEFANDTQQRMSRIINSYNTNFQQIDENTTELKEMLSEILGINSVITQKLIGTITSKIDCMTFQSAMENLNDHVIQSLHINTRKINQIGDKEFEVEHQLKAIKEMLGCIKYDYDKNYNRLKTEDIGDSLNESDHKSQRSVRRRKGLRDISPYLMSPRVEDCRFRKGDSGIYEAAGGRYNNSMERRQSFKEMNEEEDEPYTSNFSKVPSLSDELASLS